jgi:hypothetical protein
MIGRKEMKKVALILCLIMVGSMMFSTVASAGGVRRHTKPGYAVRDDNTAKEIQAIKLAINSLGQEIKMLKNDRSNNAGLETRVAFLEREYSKLNSRLNNQNIIILALIVLLIALGGYVVMGGKKKPGSGAPQ